MKSIKWSLLALCAVASLILLTVPAGAQLTMKVDVKPCYMCDEDAYIDDNCTKWVPCDRPRALNLCSKGKTALAILNYEELAIDPETALVNFEGASNAEGDYVRHAIKDVNHDGIPDLIYRFNTRQLTGLVEKFLSQEEKSAEVEACLTITNSLGDELQGCDQMVVFKRGCGPKHKKKK